MSNRILIVVMLAALVAQRSARAAEEPREVYNFNPGWKLFVGDNKDAATPSFDDQNWKSITLPHAFNEDDAFAKSIYGLKTGVAWYRKHFVLPADSAGKRVFIEFEGIRHGGEFFVNGKSIGR